MTRISFFHGARDRLQAAASWLAGAWERRERVLVYVPDAALADRLDHLLWTQPAIAFLPHCPADSPLAAETPVVITRRLDESAQPPEDQRLLSLADEIPPGFARFAELIEIVSNDDAVRLPARERFKFYRDRGYDIGTFDLGRSA